MTSLELAEIIDFGIGHACRGWSGSARYEIVAIHIAVGIACPWIAR